jgi:PAS domain S-box-containing protein/putative nucleotidyltransferase with HDIG domain
MQDEDKTKDQIIKGLRERIVEMKSTGNERKNVKEALKKSEEKFRTFMERASDLIYMTDIDGNFTYVNDSMARTLGYFKKEMIGMHVSKVVSNESYKKFYNKIDELIEKGNVSFEPILVTKNCREVNGENKLVIVYDDDGKKFTFEDIWITKDGREVYGENKLATVYDDDGKFAGGRCVFRDITDRKQAEKELKHSMENLRRAVGGIVRALMLTVEMRDPYTAGHQQRVSDLARAIATDMGLSKEKIEATRVAGTIHDLGKISIPSDILTKPSALKENEFAIIKDHPQVGYDILKEVDLPGSVSQIVLQHHERLDGSGYPLGLTGEDIFIEARILAVADVVEAMAYHRPYRPAFGIDTALQEVSKNKGTLYDPEAVDICLKLFTEKGFRLQL